MRRIYLSALCLLLASACGPEPKTGVSPVPESLTQATHGLRLEAPIVVPTRYRASLALDPAKPTFEGELHAELSIQKRARDFYLNGHGLTVHSASLQAGGENFVLQVKAEGEEWLHFESERPLPVGPAALQIQYSGQVDGNSSFGIFRQEAAGDWYIFTQFEARGARRAFPSYDQPDLKVPWTISLKVPEGQVALANTPELARKPLGAGQVQVDFAESKPLPSYLLAFAVGPFDMVDVGTTRSGVPVRVAAPKGRGAETGWVVESTLSLIEILEDYTGITYPYAKLDLVSIPATGSFGAMENPGLITYTETLLLSKDNDLGFKKAYASVGAHELAHQWFGNLVTNAWWDDLWLNESFATWGAAKVMAKFRPEWRADLAWIDRRSSAMNADRLASARVIHQPIVTEDDIGAAFDGITYAKGASVLTMFEGWLGEETFRKGIQHYLRASSWKSVTAADFLRAMDQGTGAEFSAAFASFIDNPGTPLIKFALECSADAAPTVTLQQERFTPLGSKADASQTYQIPVCLRFPGKSGPVKQCTLMTEASARLVLDQADTCPSWLVPNAGATGYYRSELPKELWASLFSKAPLTVPETLVMAKDLRALAWSGRAPLESMLSLVPKLARSEDDGIVGTAAELANLGRLVREADRRRYKNWLSKHFGRRARALGFAAKGDEPPSRKTLRSTLLSLMIFEGEDQKLRAAGVGIAERWLEDPVTVDPDLAGLALEVAAWRGEPGIYQQFVSAIKGTSDRGRRRMLLGALGRASNPETAKLALGIMLDEEIDVRETQRTLSALAGSRESGVMAFDFLVANFAVLAKRYGEEMGSRLARVVSAQCNDSQRASVQTLLNEKIAKMEGGENAAAQALERFELCVAATQALSLPTKL